MKILRSHPGPLQPLQPVKPPTPKELPATNETKEIIKNQDFVILSLPNQAFNCKTCNKNFISSSSLKIHEEIHKQPKSTFNIAVLKNETHKCNVCNQMFISLQTLNTHKGKHQLYDLISSNLEIVSSLLS